MCSSLPLLPLLALGLRLPEDSEPLARHLQVLGGHGRVAHSEEPRLGVVARLTCGVWAAQRSGNTLRCLTSAVGKRQGVPMAIAGEGNNFLPISPPFSLPPVLSPLPPTLLSSLLNISLTQPPIVSLNLLTQSRTHPNIDEFTCMLAHSLSVISTGSLILPNSPAHSLTHSLTQSLTHSLTHTLTFSHTHSPGVTTILHDSRISFHSSLSASNVGCNHRGEEWMKADQCGRRQQQQQQTWRQ